MSTIKLYHRDAYCKEFTAEVTAVTANPNNAYDIILNRTAFYPESGGQPCDTGTLNGIPVIAVRQEGDTILHTTKSPLVTGPVKGSIDWSRRYDHMQQHSGEHVLCGAAFALYGASNIGFALGPLFSHIDLDLETLSDEQIAALEQVANQAIYDCRQVIAHDITQDELARFSLRKTLAKTFSHIRLVEVKDFDCCPCGGTHVANTGEIGLIKILAWEKKKNGVRVSFVCGRRALNDYSTKNSIIQLLAANLSVPPYEVGTAYLRQQDKLDHLHKELSAAKKAIAQYFAQNLHRQAETVNQVKIVTHVQPVQHSHEISDIASSLMDYPDTVALLAGINADQNKAFLQFAAAANLAVNMNQELKKILPLIDGKGGGTASAAQGGCPVSDRIDDALSAAKVSIAKLLQQRQ